MFVPGGGAGGIGGGAPGGADMQSQSIGLNSMHGLARCTANLYMYV